MAEKFRLLALIPFQNLVPFAPYPQMQWCSNRLYEGAQMNASERESTGVNASERE